MVWVVKMVGLVEGVWVVLVDGVDGVVGVAGSKLVVKGGQKL